MKARYFKILFRNVNDGIFHIFSLWDTYSNRKINVAYVSGASEAIPHIANEDIRFANDTCELDILAIASLDLYYLEQVVGMLDSRNIHCIVMPYISKTDRRILMDQIKFQESATELTLSDASMAFLKDPYYYAKSKGVEEFIYLSGNGPAYDGTEMMEGQYFKPVDLELEQQIEKEEGYYFPVYQAGYLILNRWVFSFGVYQGNEFPTLILYHGSLEDNTLRDDCVMVVKPFSLIEPCTGSLQGEEDLCNYQCTHRGDYDCMKRHNKNGTKEYQNGTLLLGNMVLPDNIDDLYQRYAYVKEKIRFISIPNCGARENWGYRVLGFGKEHNYHYFVGPANSLSDAETIRSITTLSPYIRYAMTNEYFGLCGTGFLKERTP